MRPIKFRGKDIDSGEVVYGNLIYDAKGTTYITRIKMTDSPCNRVDPESVAQFVGYDKHGREVYEGDILQMDWNGVHYEYKAQLIGSAVAENGCYITAKQFSGKELKP